MNARWSEPDGVLSALARILAAPRAEALDRLAVEIADLVPHRAVALRTADCAWSPVKTSGADTLTEKITAGELSAIAEHPRLEGAAVEQAVVAGESRTVVVVDARPSNGRGALLVVLPDGEPAPTSLGLLARVWSVVAAAEAARADDTGPGLLTGNQAAADARRHVGADLRRTHTTTLLALLAVLRSNRRDDSAARSAATDLASAALLDLRRDSDDDRALATDTARGAFHALGVRLAPLQRYADAAVELVGPEGDGEIAQAVSIAARAATEALVDAALHERAPTRVRVAWTLDDDTLRIAVRDDGDADPGSAAVLDERVEALEGRLHRDAVPGWGTTTTVTIPLRSAEPAVPGPLEELAPRELEVLVGLSAGLRNREIARRLDLSEHTVKFHVRNVLDKLGAAHRGEAAAIARSLGLRPTA